jgi:predicted nucleic acid-binding protein
MARPTKYTPEVVDAILDALRAGNTRRASVAAAGVSEDSFGRWLAAYADFADVVRKAEAEQRFVRRIARAVEEGTWQAAAWWLERRRREDWGRFERVELSARREAERIAQEQGLDAAELIALAERIAAGKG